MSEVTGVGCSLLQNKLPGEGAVCCSVLNLSLAVTVRSYRVEGVVCCSVLNLSLAVNVRSYRGGCCLLQCFELVFSCECQKLPGEGVVCCSVLNLSLAVNVRSYRGRVLFAAVF